MAERLKVLAEPMRLKMLDELRDGEMSVQGLTSALQTSQQNASKHLGLLHQSALVRRRKDGTFVRYAIADRRVFDLLQLVVVDLEDDVGRLRRAIRDPAQER